MRKKKYFPFEQVFMSKAVYLIRGNKDFSQIKTTLLSIFLLQRQDQSKHLSSAYIKIGLHGWFTVLDLQHPLFEVSVCLKIPFRNIVHEKVVYSRYRGFNVIIFQINMTILVMIIRTFLGVKFNVDKTDIDKFK